MTPQANESSKTAPATEYSLYIMRHGSAENRGPEYPDDNLRPLTAAGKKKMREIAAGLAKLGVELDWIVSSPLVRARQTAEIVAEELGAHAALDLCDALRPGAEPEPLIHFLAKHLNRRRVLVSGHEPDFSSLAARLTGAGSRAHFAFKKGGCCLITFTEFPPKSPGQLVWWLTPKVMRSMA